jgi:hypothetical protein
MQLRWQRAIATLMPKSGEEREKIKEQRDQTTKKDHLH